MTDIFPVKISESVISVFKQSVISIFQLAFNISRSFISIGLGSYEIRIDIKVWCYIFNPSMNLLNFNISKSSYLPNP